MGVSDWTLRHPAPCTPHTHAARGGGKLPVRGQFSPPARPEVAPQCVDEPMKPSSESLTPVETRYDWVAEGNCVPERVRGEQSEAKDQPQRKLNSIRPGIVTSPLGRHIGVRAWVCGEVRGASLILSPDTPRITGTEERCRVVGVRMVRRLHGLNQESRLPGGEGAAVRALIVARKRETTVEQRRAGR